MHPLNWAVVVAYLLFVIVDGLRRGAHTVWSPGKLRYVFAVLRHLPRPIWRKVAAAR